MDGSTPASPIAEVASVAVPVPSDSVARTDRRPRPLPPSVSPTREAWRRFKRHPMAVVGMVVLLVMIAAVLIGPIYWRIPINDIDFTAKLEGPMLAHPFGTDDLGQDLLARMLYGGRISLAV